MTFLSPIRGQDRGLIDSPHVVSGQGAWCWFADPRAMHYQDDSLDMTYIGYIDVDGNIKAKQYDFLTKTSTEVLVRSYFQPDDHNNPTFLSLPDGRIMVFYTRHTDEACFYYRVSAKAGDITTLGAEYRLVTEHNTTYPSPFILAADPEHIYLCWRGISWHPTIARLTLPDQQDRVAFDWGPTQLVQSTAARPYAKYFSNGKDKIYLTYTTGHPDNESTNFVYFNYIDINSRALKDVKGNTLAAIGDKVHRVSATAAYHAKHPDAVVDGAAYRNWVWQVSQKANGDPVIAMVRIDSTKTRHDYYYAEWTGESWKKTFLAHAGGHFHQTPGLEQCYSGGLTIDDAQPNIVYGSVPIEGKYGKVYELVKYTVAADGRVAQEQVTTNSRKNNVRPYVIANSGGSELRLTWMNGDYYDWIVSSARPQGYPTAIHADFTFPDAVAGDTVLLAPRLAVSDDGKSLAKVGDITYALDTETMKPYLQVGKHTFPSTNVLGTSAAWQHGHRRTDGQWYAPQVLSDFHLLITEDHGIIRTHINGLLDQSVQVEPVSRPARSQAKPAKQEVWHALHRANDYWQANNKPEQWAFWDVAAYHTGNMEAYQVTQNQAYLAYSETWANHNQWSGAKSGKREEWKYSYGETDDYVLFGDWQICFQTYLDLYSLHPDPAKIARAIEVIDYQMGTPYNDYWWWADGLYMVMPVMTKLHKLTGNPQYLDKLYAYFRFAKALMYDESEHLFYRDAKYVYPKHTSVNGKKDFWARGDGWVFAGLAKVLQDLPHDYPHRQEFLSVYLDMAAAIIQSQRPDGYWTRSMLDPDHAPGPETSGTAFFTYGLLWGINNGYLEDASYTGAALNGWAYLSGFALQPDGRVGYVQPIGERAIPGQEVGANSTANFGVGAFLLAASELIRYIDRQ